MSPASSDPDPLRSLLHSFESEGERSDEGSFSLDPRRAIDILRAQGRLGQNAPLYLLSSIYGHTGGEAVQRALGAWSWRLHWSPDRGPLPPSLERILAEESFATHSVELHFEADGVVLKPAGQRPRAAAVLAPIFEDVASRLVHYPWAPPLERGGASPPVLVQGWQAGAQISLAPAQGTPRFLQVVRGIAFSRHWGLPVDAICSDPRGITDLTLSAIPDSARRNELEGAAQRMFLTLLSNSLEGAGLYRLDPEQDRLDSLPPFATYLSYAVRQTSDPDVGAGAAARVTFPDAMGRDWTARELLEVYAQEGKLMVVPSLAAPSEELPRFGERADRPVLIWAGQSALVGSEMFANITSGAGYLYSLAVNEQERQRVLTLGEPSLARCPVEGGRLSLLPWGEPDHIAEVEFVGPRRARETFYLDAEAPKGLRLLWESDHGLEESLRELSFERPHRLAVLELIDRSLERSRPSQETLVMALSWSLTKGGLELSKIPQLQNVPLLEDVRGRPVSLAELFGWHMELGSLPVLRDRSTSLPRELPVQPLLWWHPLLEQLGLPTHDAGQPVREAHWREAGRDRWLASHTPHSPDFPPEPYWSQGDHRVSLQSDDEAPTSITFWREGRPFGRRTFDPEELCPGYLVLWVEDGLPADTYWSGPEPAEVEQRLPAILELCRRAKIALASTTSSRDAP